MTADEMRSGTATYGRPRRRMQTRQVEVSPKPTVCPVCLTDNGTSPCPADCLSRAEEPR